MGAPQLIRDMQCQSVEYLLRPGRLPIVPNVFELMGFGFACITVPIHFIVLIIIIVEIRSNNRVNNSFYQICLIIGIVDIICLTNSYLFYSFPRWSWLRTPFVRSGAVTLHFGFFVSWGLGMVQVNLTLLMSINRYTALIYGPQHNEIWNRRNVRIMLGIILLFDLAFGSITFFSPVCIVESPNGQLMAKILNDAMLKKMYAFAGIILICCTLAMIIIYGVIFRVLSTRQKSKPQKLIIMGQNFIVKAVVQRKREGKLLKMSLIVCLIQSSITVFIITKYLLDFDPQNFIYNQLNTLYSTLNGYLLILFSDVIRKRLKNVFFRKVRPAKVSTATYLVHYSRKY